MRVRKPKVEYKLGVPSGKCQRGKFVYLLWNVPIEIFAISFIISKAQEWGGMYPRYQNLINLNKIQRPNEPMSRDKESLERHNDSLQNKRSANSMHSSREFRAVSM